jgi:hypothetical protein
MTTERMNNARLRSIFFVAVMSSLDTISSGCNRFGKHWLYCQLEWQFWILVCMMTRTTWVVTPKGSLLKLILCVCPQIPTRMVSDRCNPSCFFRNKMWLFWDSTIAMRSMVTIRNVPMVPYFTPWRQMKRTTIAPGKLWDQMESEQISFGLELINLNHNCVKTIFASLYLFVRSQTSLDHLVLSSEARRYLTIDINPRDVPKLCQCAQKYFYDCSVVKWLIHSYTRGLCSPMEYWFLCCNRDIYGNNSERSERYHQLHPR